MCATLSILLRTRQNKGLCKAYELVFLTLDVRNVHVVSGGGDILLLHLSAHYPGDFAA